MNEQRPPGGIEWCRIVLSDGTVLRGFSWNPITGCAHLCRWKTDGGLAICYAEEIANRFTKLYPRGFSDVVFHPNRLGDPLAVKSPAGIFLDSMSDVMGVGVEDEWVQQILDVCERTPWHTYQLLTKNAPRLRKFKFPKNVWVGVSSSPDYFMGKEMDDNRKMHYMRVALKVLSDIKASVRWISFEPLNVDYSGDLQRHSNVLDWAVVGAASNGYQKYPPKLSDYRATMKELDAQGIPVFFKGNMSSLPDAVSDWREDFPPWGVGSGREGLLSKLKGF